VARSFVVTHSRGVVSRGERALLTVEETTVLGLDERLARPLRAPGIDAWSLALDGDPDAEGFAPTSLRTLLGALDDVTAGAVLRAVHLARFVETHAFCGRCGAATVDVETETARRCPACTLTVYPRIAPAVIVLIRRGDQALLARNGRFPLPFFSALAGFVEIGETLEDTVVREMREEVSLELTNIRYFGSQPWPFPDSLMIGFTAEWASGDVKIDGEEIVEARFFDADALPTVPPKISIARRLIDAWVDEVRK
jgi:NAD+ diphosphatase